MPDEIVNDELTVDDILADPDAAPAERIVKVCVAGKLVAEHERLEAELKRVRVESSGRLHTGNEMKRIAEEIEAVEERIRKSTYDFVFQAMSPKRWSDLMSEHPDPEGKRIFNLETFPPVAIAASCVSPKGMDDPKKVAELFEKKVISPGQQSEMFDAAFGVNTNAPKEMKSWLASAVLRGSETNSSSATSTESPDQSSSDG